MNRLIYLFSFLLMLSVSALAQEEPTTATDAKKAEPAKTQTSKAKASDGKPTSEKSATEKPAMVQQATLNNMQMTVTGNQEQPRVLYILPWQSPATTDVDFEPLENEQKAVFSQVEREELRRELESVGEGE
jgi:hypothetical protein